MKRKKDNQPILSLSYRDFRMTVSDDAVLRVRCRYTVSDEGADKRRLNDLHTAYVRIMAKAIVHGAEDEDSMFTRIARGEAVDFLTRWRVFEPCLLCMDVKEGRGHVEIAVPVTFVLQYQKYMLEDFLRPLLWSALCAIRIRHQARSRKEVRS